MLFRRYHKNSTDQALIHEQNAQAVTFEKRLLELGLDLTSLRQSRRSDQLNDYLIAQFPFDKEGEEPILGLADHQKPKQQRIFELLTEVALDVIDANTYVHLGNERGTCPLWRKTLGLGLSRTARSLLAGNTDVLKEFNIRLRSNIDEIKTLVDEIYAERKTAKAQEQKREKKQKEQKDHDQAVQQATAELTQDERAKIAKTVGALKKQLKNKGPGHA